MSETPQAISFLQLERKIDEAVSKEAKDFAKSYQKVIRPVLRTKIKAELARDEAVKAKGTLAVKVVELEKDLVSIWLILIRFLNLISIKFGISFEEEQKYRAEN